VYKKCCKKGKNFDEKFSLKDFAQVPIPSCNPTFSAAMSPNETYEVYLREVLQVHDSGKCNHNMHIVFYEELIADCENTIRKLAKFFDQAADEMLIRQIVDAIQDSQDFPSSMNEESGKLRVGCTGYGFKEFDRHDVELIDFDWDKIVRAHFPHFTEYASVYETLLDLPYPHPRVRPFEEDLAKARRRSSGLNALAILNPAGGRKSLRELSVAKFVQKRLTTSTSSGTAFQTNSGSDGAKQKRRVDPDDSEDDE
jgi:hypothetical protein